jgi:hypothetical protein
MSPFRSQDVIPAKAGIQSFEAFLDSCFYDPGFVGHLLYNPLDSPDGSRLYW